MTTSTCGTFGWPATVRAVHRGDERAAAPGSEERADRTWPHATITSVGNYAITINWSDGHSTGIYSFEYLRALGERDAAKVVEDV